MEHRFNYFHQNPNALVNGQSTTYDHRSSSMDGARSTDNFSENMSSTSSQDQSPFHERKLTNPNAAPPTTYPLYQMDSTNQPPRSSGPPRTNVKGIYENPQSSISNVLNLAQSNAENYPINPDFQLQPHLTNLLPQQPNRVPEHYSVDKYSTNRGSIAANMNTNYFSNKSYPEPKIIEYDMEETSTESSPQHTSSLYSESTDQDSESIHPGNTFSRHTLNKNTECHVTKELKPITSSNLDLNFPVPSQFADLNLNRDDSAEDQQSILHSAYNQDDDDDIIEDIPLTDNINQNELETTLENQENPESMFNNQSLNMSGTQTFNYYSNKKDFGSTDINYENKQGSSSIFSNKINSSPFTSSSNIQNSSQFNKEPYYSQSSTLNRPGSSSSTISQPPQSKPLFPYSNIEQFNCQQVSPSTQTFDITQSGDYNQQNKYAQSVFLNSNVPQVDSKLQSNIIDSNIQDKKDFNLSTPQSQISNNQSNCPSVDSSTTSMYDLQNLPTNQQLMNSSSKPPVSELSNNSHSQNSQQFTAYNSLLMSTQSADPTTSQCSPCVSEAIVQQSRNTPYQINDDQDGIFNSSKVSKNSPIDLVNQDSKDTVKSEFDSNLSQSPSNNLVENQQEFNQSELIDKQSNESLQDNIKPVSSSSVKNLNHSNNFFNSNNTNFQLESNHQQLPINQFVPQQSVTDDNSITSSNQVSNNLISPTINNQNATVQQSASSQSAGHYFDSPNANIQPVFNQQHSQQQNVKPISSFSSENSDNNTTFFNVHNTSNQKSLLMQNELEITYKNINVGSTECTVLKTIKPRSKFDNDTPNDQFSNMTIDNKQNVPASQTFNQTTTSVSYFTKGISLDKEDKSILFQNLSSSPEDPNNPSVKLSEVNNTPQSLINNQAIPPSLNIDQSTANRIPPMPINQTVPDKSIVQQEVNSFPSQQFENKLIPNAVPPVSTAVNQSPQQILNNQPKLSDNAPYPQSSSSYSTQPFNNQQLSNTMSSVFPTSNQQISNTIPSVFSSSNKFSPQALSNEPKLNAVSSPQLISNPLNSQTTTSTNTSVPLAVNQFPPQMFTNQPKLDTVPSSQPISNLYSAPTFNNQPALSTPVNQFNSQIHNNQPKSGDVPPRPTIVNQYSSNSLDNQSIASKFPPTLSNTNQFSPQVFNGQGKLEMTPTLQPAVKGYSDPTFNSQLTQNTLPPVSSVVNQPQPQIFSNQPKSSILQPIQPAASQYSAQLFNNQPKSNMVPPVPSMAKQQNPQMMKSKSDVIPAFQSASSQYPSQPLINQPPLPTMLPPQPISNQFPPQMPSNQPRSDTGHPNKLTASRYPSQPLSNQILSGPPTQQATNQYPSHQFSNQSKPNTFPLPQAVPNQYSSLPLNSQLGQQTLPKPNQPPPGNQFYSQTNSTHPAHNQWQQPHPSVNQLGHQSAPPLSNTNFSNQTNTMFSQPKPATNLSSNLHPAVNQQTQKVSSQMLPPNALSSNNYYNQVQGNLNVEQSQPPPAVAPGQNIPLASKMYPQQSNIGFPGQQNYQQPNANYGQGIQSQHQSPYGQEQNPSVVQQGFAKTWGYDNLDLLKTRDVLPGDGVQPPEIKLPQGYANCDNCSPDIFRCTLNKFPSSKNLLDKSRLPLGILIHPYKDLSRLTVIQCETITRCRNCRSYINPFVQFTDNAHWKCNLCYRVNELPGEFQIDPYTKTLGDPSRRPEIQNATIEYIASQDYMVRPPQPALYLFLLDVSRVATLTGYLEIVCDRILNKILADDIPGDSRTNIGFITYDSAVHFYQIANNDGGQPKQLIVSDISDIFLPLPDGLMVNLEENKSAIKDLLTSLPNLYKESYNTGCALGAALQAAFKILAPRGGRVTVFQACLPNCGPGSLQPRDDGNPHTGDRVQHMAPSMDYYKKLALECSAEQIAVDMFFISSQYLDIATISGISKYSAGCIHNFPQFDVKSPTIVTRFINCFDRYLSRKIGFEALLRLRCTRGVAIHSFHGNFFVRSSDLLMLPNVNPDNAYGMQLSIEDSLDGTSVVCFQAALLYTSSNAERRIRVHTLCIPVTDNLNDVFHNADQQAIACLIAKMAVDRSTEKSLSDAREAFFNAISDSLSAFKLGCSSYNGPGTMLSPLSLKVFPLYILALLKHAAFRTNQPTRLDERMFSMCQMKSLPLNNLVQYIYPDLYPIHALEEQPKIDYEKLTEIPLPPVIQLSAERVESNGIYLMDDGETLTIFIGHKCSDQLIQKLFGFVNVHSMPELTTTITEVDSKPSYLLRSFISYLQHFKPYPLPIEIIKDNGPHKLRFYSRLVEDKFESSLSYYEFLQRISQQVR